MTLTEPTTEGIFKEALEDIVKYYSDPNISRQPMLPYMIAGKALKRASEMSDRI